MVQRLRTPGFCFTRNTLKDPRRRRRLIRVHALKHMKTNPHRSLTSIIAGTLLCSLAMPLHAWEPNAKDLDAAISSGEFAGYCTNLSTWLGQKVPSDPAKITQASLAALLTDPVVAPALAQRQIIAKAGPDKLGAFAKADAANKPFLAWLLKDRQVMDLYLEGATPLSLGAREDNSWGLSTGALEIWKKIQVADPESKDGMPLKLAIATALRPPGTGAPGSGQQKPPSDPVVRYKYFKAAHANKELFPSFDKLTVWDLQYVVSSGGSEADLTWGREMVRAWRPDYLINEKVVDTTSQMWRRNSPISHVDYKAVFAGGGKCGPRSSWSVFICQAWGIPAIGVGQPAHACVAFKGAEGTWHVGYGRGWQVSKLEGMGGTEFVACVESRGRADVFSQVEHLRWLAASVAANKEQAAAVLAVAKAANQAPASAAKDLTASLKPEEMDAEPGLVKPAAAPAKAPEAAAAVKPEPAYTPVPGVIHVNAVGYAKMAGVTSYGGAQTEGVVVHDCYTGGKQVHFQAHMQSASVTYEIDVPEAGTYSLELKVATANLEQVINVQVLGSTPPAEKIAIELPYTTGLWQTAKGPDLKLNKGKQSLEISHGFQRGIAFKSFDLKLVK